MAFQYRVFLLVLPVGQKPERITIGTPAVCFESQCTDDAWEEANRPAVQSQHELNELGADGWETQLVLLTTSERVTLLLKR
jgi:hypothetical protein